MLVYFDDDLSPFFLSSFSIRWLIVCFDLLRTMAPIVPRKRRSELGTSPAKKRPALSSTAKASSMQGKTIKRVTKPLSNCGFSCKKRHKYDVGTKILLDDSIYKGKVPANVRGHLFVYEIKDLKDGGKFVTIEYKNLVIKDGADDFHQYLESKEAQYSSGENHSHGRHGREERSI